MTSCLVGEAVGEEEEDEEPIIRLYFLAFFLLDMNVFCAVSVERETKKRNYLWINLEELAS